MQFYPINSTSGVASGQEAVPASKKTLGQEDFLKLLSVQMQAQDPMNPMADTEFISQMANFTSLEQMKSLTASFRAFISQQTSVGAQSYLGKTVTIMDSEKGLITGPVAGVSLDGGVPRLIVGDKTYDPALVTVIHSPAPAAGSSSTSTSTH